MEVPQYKLKLAVHRIALPPALRVIALAPFVILAVWLNFKVLNLDAPSWLWWFLIIASLLFAAMEYLLYYNRYSKYEYWFFLDRVEYHAKTIQPFYFSQYRVCVIKRNLFDKLLKTGTLYLSNNFKIGPIKKPEEINTYLSNLVNYLRRR